MTIERFIEITNDGENYNQIIKQEIVENKKKNILPKKQLIQLIKLECSCERIIKANQNTISEGSIICSLCETEFVHHKEMF